MSECRPGTALAGAVLGEGVALGSGIMYPCDFVRGVGVFSSSNYNISFLRAGVVLYFLCFQAPHHYGI